MEGAEGAEGAAPLVSGSQHTSGHTDTFEVKMSILRAITVLI